MQDYVVDSENLCKCYQGEIRVIVNLQNPAQKLIAKIFMAQNDPNYIKENRILTTLTNAANNENIIHLIPQNNINLILGEGYPMNTLCLFYQYYEKGNMSKYIDKSFPRNRIDESYAKYIGYKLIRAVDVIHQNNIAHNKLTIHNIMFDNNFEPFIIHFIEANDNINNNLEFVEDNQALANILLILISDGLDVKMEIKNNNLKFLHNGKKIPEELFWKYVGNPSDNFKAIIHSLMENNNINLSNLLQNPWFQGVVQTPQIREGMRAFFNTINQNLIDNPIDIEYEFSEYIGNTEINTQIYSLFNDDINMKGISGTNISEIFKKMEIRKTKFKPNGVLFNYLLLKLKNYNRSSNFFNDFMFKLYSELPTIKSQEGFYINSELASQNCDFSYLSFNLEIKEIDKNEQENYYEHLIINLELIEFDDKSNDTNNQKKFYLLFNYIQGEILYYYQFLKLFKQKAREILNGYFSENKLNNNNK